jgi:mannose-6-phosphate isomerase
VSGQPGESGPRPGEDPVAVEGASEARVVPKPWGHELIWVHTDKYVGKILVIEAGKRLSMQYHRKKDESIYVLSGRLRLHLEDDAGTVEVRDLGPGEFARVPVGRRHRYEGVQRVEVMEVSTPELDDVVRLDDDYGREGTSEP